MWTQAGRLNPVGRIAAGAQMPFERRLEAVVPGSGGPGQVKVALSRGQHQFVADVPVELLQPSVRIPNSEFVAVVKGSELVRTELAGKRKKLPSPRRRQLLRPRDPSSAAPAALSAADGLIFVCFSRPFFCALTVFRWLTPECFPTSRPPRPSRSTASCRPALSGKPGTAPPQTASFHIPQSRLLVAPSAAATGRPAVQL